MRNDDGDSQFSTDDFPAADSGLIVSAELYGSTVDERVRSLDPAAFREVDVKVPKFTDVAWVAVPGPDAPETPPVTAEESTGPRTEPGTELRPPATSAEPREAAGWDFFISVADADEHWGAWIAEQLERRYYRVHLEAWDRLAGDRRVGRLDDAVMHSRRTLVILSDNYLRSGATQAEWHAAWKADPDGMKRKLILVRVADCNPEGLLGAIAPIDLVGVAEVEAEARLIEQIERSLTGRYRPADPPPFPGTRTP